MHQIHLPDRSDPNTPGCGYFVWIFQHIATFIAIAVIVFMVSFCLCCGRCCCKGKKGTNKQGCTGGNYPTREYNKMEGVACISMLAIWMLCIFAFTVLGASIWDVGILLQTQTFPPSARCNHGTKTSTLFACLGLSTLLP